MLLAAAGLWQDQWRRLGTSLGDLHGLGQDRHRTEKVGAVLLQFLEFLEPRLCLRRRDGLSLHHIGLDHPGDPITETPFMVEAVEHGHWGLPEGLQTRLAQLHPQDGRQIGRARMGSPYRQDALHPFGVAGVPDRRLPIGRQDRTPTARTSHTLDFTERRLEGLDILKDLRTVNYIKCPGLIG